ncbi:MAG: hypothetical protein BroJett025_08590 [Patescibacteria group bacterium]|nr:MAG: hypothetical protein BroJett025_08590 [Patescibacteria group bacterium]
MFRKNPFYRSFFVLFLIIAVVSTACGVTPSGTTTSPGTAAPIVSPTVGPQPSPHPEPWESDQNAFMAEIDWNILAMAVVLPYANFTPDNGDCADFWEHQVLRHLPGGEADSIHTLEELNKFLTAVETGDPGLTLVKVALRSGGGIAALYRWAGRQWLFFTGSGLLPTAYRPLSQDAVKNAIRGVQTYKTAPRGVNTSLANSARCFREAQPKTVEVTVEETVQLPVSKFTGTYDFGVSPTPVVGVDATQPVLTPVPVGSYGLVIAIEGTPPAVDVANYVYDPSHAAYVWSPQGGGGLTPQQLAEVVLLGGGTIVVVGIIVVTAELWLPVVVIGAPAAGALVPAFAP